MQGELEAAGFATISLSMLPDLTATTKAPRIAAIGHPFGSTLGLPGDTTRHRDVLQATLHALATISQPGAIVDLPFDGNPTAKPNTRPPQPPPIVNYLRRHPWALPRFFNRTPPEPDETAAP